MLVLTMATSLFGGVFKIYKELNSLDGQLNMLQR